MGVVEHRLAGQDRRVRGPDTFLAILRRGRHASDGIRTFDVTATGTDQETDQAKAYYYQPGLSADVDYDRFIHRLEHDPLNNMANPSTRQPPAGAATPGPLMIKQDLGTGQDYAVRVQEFKARSRRVADDLRVRLDLWGMQKDGVRQVNAVAMCFTQTDGHPGPARSSRPSNAFSGTLPRAEHAAADRLADHGNQAGNRGPPGQFLAMEYSRPMRGFTADDQTTSRFYNTTGNSLP